MVDTNTQHLYWKGKDDRWVFYKSANTWDRAKEYADRIEQGRDKCETMIVTEPDEFVVMCRRKDGQVQVS